MFKMVKSNQALNDILPSCAFDLETRRLFLTELEKEEALELLEFLEKIESVSKEIQRNDPLKDNLYTVRVLFDRLIRDFPDENLESAIGRDAVIVHNKHFENAIVKLQGPSDAKLSRLEEEAVKIFKIDVTTDTQEERHNDREEGYAARILREDAEKIQKKQKRADYRSVAHVASNNNKCERLFSGTKLVMTDQRKCMDPSTLEMVTMLDENSDLWDAADIQEIALNWKRDGVIQEPEAVEIAEYQSDDDDDDFREEVDFDVDIRGADVI